MKLIVKILVLIAMISGAHYYSNLKAVERLASGVCTHYKPKFVKKSIMDENGNQIGEKLVIDIGNGQEIPAGDDWDSYSLASTDERITFDYDIKTRRQYKCHQITDSVQKRGMMVECKTRGFNHGMITNGSKDCFTSW